MAAPSQVSGSPVATVFNATGTPKTTTAITVHVGDILVILWGAENEVGTTITPSNSGTAQTWTSQAFDAAGAGWGQARIWTAVSTVAASMTATVTCSASPGFNGVAFYVFDGTTSGGVGNSGHAKSATSPGASGTLPSVSVSCSANSAIVAINTDWSALSHGATRSYDTSNAGAATEQQYFSNGSNYSEESWAHADVGAAGSKTVGLTTPINQTWKAMAVEILGSAGATAAATPRNFNAIPFMGGVL